MNGAGGAARIAGPIVLTITKRGGQDMKKALLSAGFLALAMTAGAVPSAQALPRLDASKATGVTENVGWRSHCAYWRGICADRWGWGTWRYRRCMFRHGC